MADACLPPPNWHSPLPPPSPLATRYGTFLEIEQQLVGAEEEEKGGGREILHGEEKRWKRVVTSVLLCFGGGVLFATSLIHMLPEVIVVYSEYYTQNYKSKKDFKNIFVGTRKS